MIRELTSRFVNNLEFHIHYRTALYASLLCKSISKLFKNIKTTMSTIVYDNVLTLSEMWLDESICTDIISFLCESKEWTPDHLIHVMIYLLNSTQLSYLYSVLENYKTIMERDNKMLNIRFDPIIVHRVNTNLNLIQSKLDISNSSEIILKPNPMTYWLDDHHIKEYNTSHLSQQGLNEIFYKEEIKCSHGSDYIYHKMKMLDSDISIEEIQKEINEANYKEKKSVIQDYTSRIGMKPSRLFCISCKKDYDNVCQEVKKCKTNLSMEENKKLLSTIQSCMQKRIMYAHTCEYKLDDGHQSSINQLEQNTETCKGIIVSKKY
jgi:hypothetical protein